MSQQAADKAKREAIKTEAGLKLQSIANILRTKGSFTLAWQICMLGAAFFAGLALGMDGILSLPFAMLALVCYLGALKEGKRKEPVVYTDKSFGSH